MQHQVSTPTALVHHQASASAAVAHTQPVIGPNVEQQQASDFSASENYQVPAAPVAVHQESAISSNSTSLECNHDQPKAKQTNFFLSEERSKIGTIDDRPRHSLMMLSKDEYQEHHSVIIQAR